jgi:hypothetical protein
MNQSGLFKKIFFLIVLIGLCSNVYAQKIDTIIHINGNILKGDFKKMNYGVITWKMDGMGTISVEETKVNTIISNKKFEIKTDDGIIYFGSFKASPDFRSVILVLDEQEVQVLIEDIVEIYPIKSNFWRRTSGNFSLGVNYAKGSNVATLAFSGNLDYRKRKGFYSVSWDLNDTYQGDTLSASKGDITLDWQRTIKNGWSTNVSTGLNRNLELGTKSRISLNAMGIKDITYNEWNRLYVGMGLNISRETPYGDGAITEDLTGLLQVKWKVYKLTNPKLWVDSDISFLPYFTDSGRNRVMFNLTPKVSIFSNNFKIGFNFYYNYDSKPTTDTAANDDYGLNLQFTYYLSH